MSSAAERTENILTLYLREIRRQRLLTRKQEQRLGAAILEGKKPDATPQALRAKEEAKQELVKANLLLVVAIIYKRFLKTVKTTQFMDLIQEGNIVLLTVAENFDYRKGYRFSTYATSCLVPRMTEVVANKMSEAIHLPEEVRKRVHRLQNLAKIAEQDYQRRWTDEDYARYLGVSPEEVRVTKNAGRLQQLISLDAPLDAEGKKTLVNSLKISTAGLFENRLVDRMFIQQLLKENIFSERERDIISARFGLNSGHKQTLADVGREFSITKERVRQIQDKVLEKLKNLLKQQGIL
ncbi:RNA polymerase sigma factor RpoD [Candidatus Termititenax persephonae]|uniref:RNA polymerase sigma factor RpoD n=1 Tax=Candidatus Termititenax persephonae TaxID=2218525 RepID=A0A388TFD0_9BACT|nr:RNA polymerase sigma factor RpoD [Candidatus Termititenax persephonae]